MKGKAKAVIMDRDGTLFKDCHYLSRPDDIQMYKGVFPALKKLSGKGWKLIIGTNQSGIGRGYFSIDMLEKVHKAFLSMCRKNRIRIDEILFCPHHPEEGCSCRKPEIGMILQAAKKFNLDLKKCVVVGDKESDIRWGMKAGTKTVLVLTGHGREHRRKMKVKPAYVARLFPHAAEWILKNG